MSRTKNSKLERLHALEVKHDKMIRTNVSALKRLELKARRMINEALVSQRKAITLPIRDYYGLLELFADLAEMYAEHLESDLL
jgi:hypothetical protein